MTPVTHAKIAYWKFTARIAPELMWLVVKVVWLGFTKERFLKNEEAINACVRRSNQLSIDRKFETVRVYEFHKRGFEFYVE